MNSATDETQPLLRDADVEGSDKAVDEDIVDFDPNDDSENPRNWPKAYKWGIVALLAFMSFTVTFTCISVVPIASAIVYDLSEGHSRKSASVLLVTIWELGEAAGPLFIAPLSEIFGRSSVYNVANVLFVAATVLAALCQNTPLFIAARALTGLAVASNVLNPAIVGDMFISEQRGSAMSLIMIAPLVGGAVGPAIAGGIAQSLGWRQVLWMAVILACTCEVIFLICFRETYKVTILSRRAARLRKETGNPALRTVFDTEESDDGPNVDDEKSSNKFWRSIMRPAVVFLGSDVLQAMSLFSSLLFSYFYIMSTTLPDILQDLYGLSPALTGSVFITFSIGSAAGLVLCNLTLDRIYVNLRDSSPKGIGQPEYRLPLVIVGGFGVPLVVAAYGWIAQARLPLWLLLISLGLLGSTFILGFLPLLAYIVDTFKLYSASAMTAIIVTRCLMGTFLPLTVEPLVKGLGYGWAFTALSSASLCLAPIPVLLLRYGSKWRQRSEYTQDE
ncbi:uncharacterized protein Z518_05996 [Rhinocladiella mackenziei CBS 650.93]|uniref:Major facilitator superfamily (MFS) profile domain-containing protein n=1 Tax=Rhinocladiella mackenziei CBS 650.93 TaxID=1442369 RepID=A0A0D2IH83_9EURO|nr:uncharacterized protein Z518_05996 [Rhinocladiella mackenziei CBS 650.93]KIX05124.1 hypothetical protein Z518_05996 [Rhinocladiella mackenziei CBS 650.93]